DKDNLELGDEKLETDSKKSRIQKPAHPLLIRLSVSDRYNGAGLEAGAFISVKAKLERPMPASLPSGYDYAEVAYFQNIVATGHALEQPRLVKTADPSSFFLKMAAIHQQLTRHIIQKTGAESGPIAAAFVTNDVGSISDSDNIAMRKAGLTHLLSVGGMHIAVVIGAVIFISIRLLALFPYLALHYPLRLIAAINGAFIGLIYTFIAGCEIPTVRSMLTAALILWGIALGRRAFSLRLVAAAAMIIMIFRPESVLSPSFQLSFAAVTTVIALAEAPEVKRLFEHYEVGWLKKIALIAGEILLSGAVVEAVVAPITIYHFHQSGLYGAIANILAIPLTTFIIIPAEAAALATDVIGCSAPFWWITAYGIHFLLVIAHYVAALPMAGIMLPMMQASTCLLLMMGWLWLGLWKSRWRLWGIALLLLGLMIVIFTPRPDVLINRDGETIVFKTNPRPLSYRFIWAKNNPYNQDQAATILGFEKAQQIPPFHESACQKSPCMVKTDDQRHALLVIRGKAKSPPISLCETSDLVISDQILPESCHPKIAKIDPCMLIKTGGMALYWSPKKQGFPQIITTQSGHDQHPWIKSILPVACRS
ncbi:MAG: ComEC/Rec2 family competence protein, partial [Zymomonas mobilis subsp. pomaceae]